MYRAYWAVPRTLKTSQGEQVNTVFGVASMLLSILAAEEPDALLFCFDEGSETFRHQEMETYKDGRADTPDDFYVQIPRVFELIRTCHVQSVSNPQFEADDFIGTYARRAAEQGARVTVVSGDRDLLQLASDNIRIAIPHQGYRAAEYLGPAEVLAKYGVTPAQIPAYKGMMGDSSDNLPGVKGIGPKGASELLQRFGSLEGIYEHIADIAPKTAEKLIRDKEQAFFCERLATLHTDVPLPLPLTDLSLQGLPAADMLGFFRNLEFRLLLGRMQSLLQSAYGKTIFAEVSEKDKVQMVDDAPQAKSQLSLF